MITKVDNWLKKAHDNKQNLTFLIWYPLYIQDLIIENLQFDLKTSYLKHSIKELLPKIKKSKYKKRKFKYLYNKIATNKLTHYVFVLSTT